MPYNEQRGTEQEVVNDPYIERTEKTGNSDRHKNSK